MTWKACLPVIDIGSGTGIGARLLAGRGLRVVGIDPGSEMLRAGAPHDHVRLIEGKAEQIPLRSGRLALVWNDWDLRDEFTASFVRLMRSAAGARLPGGRCVHFPTRRSSGEQTFRMTPSGDK